MIQDIDRGKVRPWVCRYCFYHDGWHTNCFSKQESYPSGEDNHDPQSFFISHSSNCEYHHQRGYELEQSKD